MSKRTLKGIVVSTKMDKTAVVEVGITKKHSKYGKIYLSHSKYKVHDEKNELKEGMHVVLEETKPVSKSKCWIVKEVIS